MEPSIIWTVCSERMLKSYHFDLAYLAVAKYDKASLDHWRLENESRWPSWALKLESGVQFLPAPGFEVCR